MRASQLAFGLAMLLFGSALSACDSSTDTFCTEVTCFDGLAVGVRAVPETEVQVTASESGGESRSASCTVLQNGSCQVFFDGFKPEQVTLNVSGAGQQVSLTLQPDYEVLQPNGPDCPPTCHHATVTVDLQEGA